MERGRPTSLTNEMLREIRKLTLEGKTLREIAKISNTPEGTLYAWTQDNYLNLRNLIDGWKRDRKLALAEGNLEELLMSSDEKIKADMTKFTLQTLGRKDYSTRTEHTGEDGSPIIIKWADVVQGDEDSGGE